MLDLWFPPFPFTPRFSFIFFSFLLSPVFSVLFRLDWFYLLLVQMYNDVPQVFMCILLVLLCILCMICLACQSFRS